MSFARNLITRLTGRPSSVAIQPVKSGAGWLTTNFSAVPSLDAIDLSPVRVQAAMTSQLGAKPLWDGYKELKDYPRDTTGTRSSDQVRTSEDLGGCYAWLAEQRRPDIIVEFGTAFGVSGMYWLTGLERAGSGKLMTYEPNDIWADIAEGNLRAISNRFILTRGTFEDNAAATLKPKSVDIAFIDAIHTSEFVYSQYDKLRPFMKDGALVLFDDINFSDDMRQCWNAVARRPEVLASAQIGDRVGIIELG